MNNVCGCGCGGIPKKGNRFINGHNSRVFSPEIRERIRKKAIGRVKSLEERKKLSIAQKGIDT